MKKRFTYYNINKKLLTLLIILVVLIVILLYYNQQFQQTHLKFYIFQTSDTHGHLNNKSTEHSNGWLKLGGVLKKEIEKVGGYDNCILIDCGDTFQGTVDALESKGKLAISIMNNLKYDVFVPGNHDFDFGIDSFLNRISNLKADVIAANLIIMIQSQKELVSRSGSFISKKLLNVEDKTLDNPPLPPTTKLWRTGNPLHGGEQKGWIIEHPVFAMLRRVKRISRIEDRGASNSTKEILSWKIYTRNNIKIAVIGMTSPYLKYWLWGKGHERYKVAPISETLAKVMPEVLKANPDFTVLAIHHGVYNSKRFPGNDNFLRTVIKKYPQIDIVFGGHTHQRYPGENLYNSSVYVQPGAHAEYFSKVEVTVDKYGENSPKIQTELIPVQSTIKPDKELADIAADSINKSSLKRREIIGKTSMVIDDKGTPGIDNKMSRFFANAVLYVVKADAVMCTVINPGYNLSGNITYDDIFNICPYEDSIGILSLSHDELRTIIKEQDTYKDKYRKKLGLYGVDLYQKNLLVFFKKNDRINVAFSSYDIASAGNRYPVLKAIAQKKEVQAFDTKILLRDAVVQYIREKFLKEN